MTSSPITSWPIEREKVEAVTDFLLLDSKITVDGDYSHEIREWLLLGKKAMANLDSVLKSKGITLQTKVCLVKVMVFPVVMYGCQSCTIKKAEHQRIDAFELWCWRRRLRVLWTARRSNQSILEESPLNTHWKDWCWSWTPILWSPDANTWLIGKDPDAGKEWKQKRATEGEMAEWHHHTKWTWTWANSGRWWGPWGREESDTTGQLNNNSIYTWRMVIAQ